MDYILTTITIILACCYLSFNFLKKNILKKNTEVNSCNKCGGCSKSCGKKNN